MITLDKISFSYNDAPFIEDLSLSLPPERFIAVLGPNGSGKTTLLKLLLGLLIPDRGTIRLNDRDTSGLPQRKRAALLAYVPQNMESSYDFTVEETVLMGRYPHRSEWQRETAEDRKKARRAMELMEIADFSRRSVHSLSGGEKQRVLIARALAQETPVMLLDEPTAFLDLRHQLGIMKLIRRITEEEKKTVVSVVHDLNLAMNYADRAVLMQKGALMSEGRPEDVLSPENVRAVYGVETERVESGGRAYVLPVE